MGKISLFLVEDEVVIRKGIEKSINWEENGFEFVGEAGDGEVALPLILKQKPDILITDIKMPFMNGLELSRIVKKELPDIKIIILSGYNEFDYAKEAINLSVTEYLLKPISASQLMETLNKVKETIISEREEKELRRKYKEEMQENTENAKIKFFRKLIFEEMSTADAIEAGKKYHLNLSAGMYAIIMFKILPAADSENTIENTTAVEDMIDQMVKSNENIEMIQKGVEGWAFLLMADDEAEMKQRVSEFTSNLHKTMKNYPRLEYFGGIGRNVVRVRELKKSFRDADKAFIGRFSMNPNQIISLEDLNNNTNAKEESLEVVGFANVEHSRELIGRFLYNGSQNELEDFLAVYMDEFARDILKTELMRQYLVMDIYVTVMSFCEKLGAVSREFSEEAENLRNRMQKQQSVQEMENDLKELLYKVVELRDSLSARRYSDIINSAQTMIAQNYMQEDISLNTVADGVGMSPSYFSSIFSKEVGKTFVEYLTEIRMEKAKELLICSSMKTADIGHSVGYRDSHYFSYIFKKKQGCSPKEYRARKKVDQ